MKVVISQPRYLPVISYIQRLVFADTFVLLDNVKRQYAGWENRNKLLLPEPKWLTIPIASSRMEIIRNARINGKKWVQSHKDSIFQAYRNHPYFNRDYIDAYYDGIEKIIDETKGSYVDVIEGMLRNLGAMFDFEPNLVRASSVEDQRISEAKGPEKLLRICEKISADIYVSGENGRAYGVCEAFRESNIEVRFHAAQTFTYDQPGRRDFVPYMAFFDALFCVGKERLAEELFRRPELTPC